MQVIQLIFALVALGLISLTYYGVISSYINCNAGDCGASHLIYLFAAPIVLIISITTFILASKKLLSTVSTIDEKKSASIIKWVSLISIMLAVAPIVLPIILDTFITLFENLLN